MTTTWATLGELLEEIQCAQRRLVAGEMPVDQAHAEARLLGTAAKILGVRLEHARLTGRLEQGSDALPDVRLSGNERPR